MALLLSACDGGGEPSTAASHPSGEGEAAFVPFVAGDRVYLEPADAEYELQAPLSPALAGTLAPAAVPAGDPRRLLYTSTDGRRPVLRLGEFGSGDDLLVDDGAYSAAWRAGAIAYVKGLQPELGDPREYLGHVVVRNTLEAQPVRWTEAPARYVVAAWAGPRLLAYRLRSGWPDLLVFDGPRRARELGRAGLIAVSPDGERVVVSEFGTAPPRVRVLDLASGRELAATAPEDLAWVLHSGSWSEDRVVAAVEGGLAIFRVRRESIELLEVLELAGPDLPPAVSEPQFVDGRRVVAWGEIESRAGRALPDATLVECDLDESRCRPGRRLSSGAEPRLVYNPSRP